MVQLPSGVTTDSILLVCVLAAVTLWLARFLTSFLSRVSPLGTATMAEAPPPEPVHCGELTLEELSAFDGRDPTKPLYLVRRARCRPLLARLSPCAPTCAGLHG